MSVSTDVFSDVKSVDLHGVKFTAWTQQEVIAHIMRSLAEEPHPAQQRGGSVFTPNVDILRALVTQPAVNSIGERSTLVVADGMPLVWASALQGTPLPERVTGASLLGSMCAAAAAHGRSVFLLGGAEGVSEEAANRLREKYSGLEISGWSPAFGLEATPEGMQEIISRVVASDADLVFCGFGFPKQERIIAELGAALPDAWFVGCGASLNFAAGRISRAPLWMQNSGLEWMHRLFREPRRMFRRYVINDIPFAIKLLIVALLRGFAAQRPAIGARPAAASLVAPRRPLLMADFEVHAAPVARSSRPVVMDDLEPEVAAARVQ